MPKDGGYEKNSLPVISTTANYVPVLVSRERFSEMVGLPVGVVIGFINRGYLPTMTIGKYSLVNLELLRKRALEKEFT